MEGIYSALAEFYDVFGDHINYEEYGDFAHRINKTHGTGTSGIALDLACGTGSMSLVLADKGYEVIAADGSPDMLAVAAEKARDAGKNILFLCQDMRELDLYGTVDLVSCTVDSLNYITSPRDVRRVFSLVNNFLEPGGVFVFDVNTQNKFRKVYGENSYVFEDEGAFCAWQNYYDEKSGKCEFFISIFRKDEDGRYTREDESHVEKCHRTDFIKKELESTGFQLLGIYSDFNGTAATEGDMRHFYVAKNIKEKTWDN